MKKVAVSFLILTCSGVASLAHEFWMQCGKFRFALGEEVKIDFVSGENFDGEYWDLKKHKVQRLELWRKQGKIDLTKEVKTTAGKNLAYKFTSEGTQLFGLESNAAFIELEAEKFNQYLEEDGLDNIRDWRKSKNLAQIPSKEFYTRYAKLLVQAGPMLDDTYKKVLNFPVEIIPQVNPYSLKVGDYMSCMVNYQGKPCAHQLVKVWSKVGNTSFLQNIYTENDGTIRFPVSVKGPWMISTVRMKVSEVAEADYQSMWGSLAFGIE